MAITGERSIAELKLLTVLNYLEIDKDYNQEVAKAEKRALNNARRR